MPSRSPTPYGAVLALAKEWESLGVNGGLCASLTVDKFPDMCRSFLRVHEALLAAQLFLEDDAPYGADSTSWNAARRDVVSKIAKAMT